MSTRRKEIIPADFDHQDRWDRRRRYYTTDFYVVPLGDWDEMEKKDCPFDRGRICGDMTEALELAAQMIATGLWPWVSIVNEHGVMGWTAITDSEDPKYWYKDWEVLYYADGGYWKYDGKDLTVVTEDLMPPLPLKDRTGLIKFPTTSG